MLGIDKGGIALILGFRNDMQGNGSLPEDLGPYISTTLPLGTLHLSQIEGQGSVGITSTFSFAEASPAHNRTLTKLFFNLHQCHFQCLLFLHFSSSSPSFLITFPGQKAV